MKNIIQDIGFVPQQIRDYHLEQNAYKYAPHLKSIIVVSIDDKNDFANVYNPLSTAWYKIHQRVRYTRSPQVFRQGLSTTGSYFQGNNIEIIGPIRIIRFDWRKLIQQHINKHIH